MKLIDLEKVVATLIIDACRVPIGMYAYSGCNNVSAFAGNGKAKALKLSSTNKEI